MDYQLEYEEQNFINVKSDSNGKKGISNEMDNSNEIDKIVNLSNEE